MDMNEANILAGRAKAILANIMLSMNWINLQSLSSGPRIYLAKI
jgi:hypothetical protein